MPDTGSARSPTFLEFLPVSLFGAVMGLCGLSFAWRLAYERWQVSPLIAQTIGGIAILGFIVLAIAYLLKCKKYPALVKKELDHPVQVSFFATIIISLLLIPGIILPYNRTLAVGIWAVGAVAILFFALFVLRKWIDKQQEPASAMPAWILPIVGTLDVPIVGYKLAVPGIHEICLVFYGVGLIFAIILLTVIFSRLLFQPPLPTDLQPTVLILLGPFALAFSGYEGLTGNQDLAASIFFYFDLFLLLLLGSKIALIPKCCPFKATWWAVSFPLSAFTIAAFHYAEHASAPLFGILAGALLTLTSGVIVYIFMQTITRIVKGTFISALPK